MPHESGSPTIHTALYEMNVFLFHLYDTIFHTECKNSILYSVLIFFYTSYMSRSFWKADRERSIIAGCLQ